MNPINAHWSSLPHQTKCVWSWENESFCIDVLNSTIQSSAIKSADSIYTAAQMFCKYLTLFWVLCDTTSFGYLCFEIWGWVSAFSFCFYILILDRILGLFVGRWFRGARRARARCPPGAGPRTRRCTGGTGPPRQPSTSIVTRQGCAQRFVSSKLIGHWHSSQNLLVEVAMCRQYCS